jgi:hypothetical protein
MMYWHAKQPESIAKLRIHLAWVARFSYAKVPSSPDFSSAKVDANSDAASLIGTAIPASSPSGE